MKELKAIVYKRNVKRTYDLNTTDGKSFFSVLKEYKRRIKYGNSFDPATRKRRKEIGKAYPILLEVYSKGLAAWSLYNDWDTGLDYKRKSHAVIINELASSFASKVVFYEDDAENDYLLLPFKGNVTPIEILEGAIQVHPNISMKMAAKIFKKTVDQEWCREEYFEKVKGIWLKTVMGLQLSQLEAHLIES